TVRSEREVHPGAKVPLALRSDDEAVRTLLTEERQAIETLVKTDRLDVEPCGAERPKGAALTSAADVEVLVMLRGIVEAANEKARIERELKKTQKSVAALEKKLAAKGFAERAPAEVVAETKEQLASMKERLSLLEEARTLAEELE
ncbi:MAG: valine--tRNA ligase, partial [Deltaproteobacteria bacterium]|nr:valine--tRNA ligase [Deltaproteobacteria bacterium]